MPKTPIKSIIICLILSLCLTGCTGIAALGGSSSVKSSDLFLTDREKKVDELLSGMKKDADKLYPEGMPYGIIDHGTNTPVNESLYEFCKALPKGGDLHVHDELVIPFSEYFRVLTETPDIYIDLDGGDDKGYLYSGDHPNTAVLLKDALSSGRVSEIEIRKSLLLTADGTPGERWKVFSRAFNIKRNLSKDRDLMEKIYEAGFRSCCNNNVDLLETRVYFSTDDASNKNLCESIRRAYYKVKKDYPGFVVRIIASSGKKQSVTIETAEDSLRSAIRLSKEIKDEYDPAEPKNFIIGLDLVHEEDVSKPLSEYEAFFNSKEVKDSGLLLFLHAGESLRDDNVNVKTARDLGPTRIGHGFNLYKYPELMTDIFYDDIAIEVCPISNYRLGYVDDLRNHPATTYIKNDIPIVIASDDGLFLEDDPLVNDYYAAILAWDLNIKDIKNICKNNIFYSGLSTEEQNELSHAWEEKWNSFIDQTLQGVKQ